MGHQLEPKKTFQKITVLLMVTQGHQGGPTDQLFDNKIIDGNKIAVDSVLELRISD